MDSSAAITGHDHRRARTDTNDRRYLNTYRTALTATGLSVKKPTIDSIKGMGRGALPLLLWKLDEICNIAGEGAGENDEGIGILVAVTAQIMAGIDAGAADELLSRVIPDKTYDPQLRATLISLRPVSQEVLLAIASDNSEFSEVRSMASRTLSEGGGESNETQNDVSKSSAAEGIAKDMALIPAGDFLMGSPEGVGLPDEHPQHKVYLDAFYMDKYDVTVEDYAICVQKGKCTKPGTGHSCNYGVVGRERHPINCVGWHQAQAYCKWVGKRLPTEAEWEKAARGGTNTQYFFGDDASKLGDYAWFTEHWDVHDSSERSTHPVGQKKPNQFGLFDMVGNELQWVADWYDETYYQKSPGRNPQGPKRPLFSYDPSRVARGGAWNLDSNFSRAAYRCWSSPDDAVGNGFRCARQK